jgi:TetR/AcrR family transcriptional regulator, transcriptional repressor for nem operon
MARPREFNEAEAIRRAVEVFWSKGYEAASLSDLMAATGLSKSSLYQAFGDKRQLFLRGLESYRDERFRQLNEYLNDGQPARWSLEGFFRAVVAERPPLGCMTCNIGVELASHDAEIRRLFERQTAVVEQAFLGTIKRGQADGSISKRHDPLRLARLLVVCLQGLQVAARALADQARLDDAVATLMAMLD